MTKAEFQAKVIELQSKGYSPKGAEKMARRIRKATHPAHLAAMARQREAAEARAERLANLPPCDPCYAPDIEREALGE